MKVSEKDVGYEDTQYLSNSVLDGSYQSCTTIESLKNFAPSLAGTVLLCVQDLQSVVCHPRGLPNALSGDADQKLWITVKLDVIQPMNAPLHHLTARGDALPASSANQIPCWH